MSDPLLIDYARRHAAEMAALLAGHGADEVLQTLRELPADAITCVLPVLQGSLLQRVVDAAGNAMVAEWLDAADFDQAAAVLVRLLPERRQAIIERLASHHRRVDLSHRFAWPAGALGALAARNFVSVPAGATLRDVVDELSRHGDAAPADGEEPRIYVLDDAGRLLGELDVHRALETEDRELPVLRLLVRIESLPADMPLSAALEALVWRRATMVPVVDRDQRPVGVVTLAAVRDGTRGIEAGSAAFETIADLATRFLEVLGGLAALAFGGAPVPAARRDEEARR